MKEIRYAITEQFKWSDKRLIMWSLRMSHHVISIITSHFLSQQIITTCEMWPEYLVTNMSAVQASISILKFSKIACHFRVLGYKEVSQLDAYRQTAPCSSNSLRSQRKPHKELQLILPSSGCPAHNKAIHSSFAGTKVIDHPKERWRNTLKP